MHARLCSDLAYNCNEQSSCVLVGQIARPTMFYIPLVFILIVLVLIT